MKPLRFCLMIGLLVASITSIGATIPDWQRSSKNVVESEPQLPTTIFGQTASKMVVIGISDRVMIFAQTSSFQEVVSQRIEATKIYLADINYAIPEIEVVNSNYSYLHEKVTPKIPTAVVNRLPRDGIRERLS